MARSETMSVAQELRFLPSDHPISTFHTQGLLTELPTYAHEPNVPRPLFNVLEDVDRMIHYGNEEEKRVARSFDLMEWLILWRQAGRP